MQKNKISSESLANMINISELMPCSSPNLVTSWCDPESISRYTIQSLEEKDKEIMILRERVASLEKTCAERKVQPIEMGSLERQEVDLISDRQIGFRPFKDYCSEIGWRNSLSESHESPQLAASTRTTLKTSASVLQAASERTSHTALEMKQLDFIAGEYEIYLCQAGSSSTMLSEQDCCSDDGSEFQWRNSQSESPESPLLATKYQLDISIPLAASATNESSLLSATERTTHTAAEMKQVDICNIPSDKLDNSLHDDEGECEKYLSSEELRSRIKQRSLELKQDVIKAMEKRKANLDGIYQWKHNMLEECDDYETELRLPRTVASYTGLSSEEETKQTKMPIHEWISQFVEKEVSLMDYLDQLAMTILEQFDREEEEEDRQYRIVTPFPEFFLGEESRASRVLHMEMLDLDFKINADLCRIHLELTDELIRSLQVIKLGGSVAEWLERLPHALKVVGLNPGFALRFKCAEIDDCKRLVRTEM